MSKEKRLMENTLIIAIGSLFTKCVSFFMVPLYTSFLAIQEYGAVDVVSSYTGLLTIILTLQLELGVFRHLVEARNDPAKQKQYVTWTIGAISAVVALFLLVAGPVLRYMRYEYTFFLLAITATNIFSTVFLQIPRGLGDNKTYAIASCIQGSASVFLSVLFVATFQWGAQGLLTASVLSNALCGVYVCVKLRIWKYISFSTPDAECLRMLLRYSLPLIPQTLTWWVIGASDRVIISGALGVAFNGIYAIANKFPSVFSLISNIFQQAWTESAAENVTVRDRNLFYNRTVNRAVRFYSSCCVGIIAVLPFVFGFLVKGNYTDAYLYIPILMIAALFHSVTALYGSIYLALKATKEMISSTLAAAVINVAVNLLLIRYIGLFAAAFSTLVAHGTILVVRYRKFRSLVNITFEKPFLIREGLVYFVVLLSYYAGNRIVQGVILLGLIPYCIYSNGDTLSQISKGIIAKIRGAGKE